MIDTHKVRWVLCRATVPDSEQPARSAIVMVEIICFKHALLGTRTVVGMKRDRMCNCTDFK